jgi:hypothetical protein
MNSLESVLISGNHLFIMSKSAEGVLALEAMQYTSTDVMGIKKSYQHDMIIPPEHANNFGVEFHGEFVFVVPGDVNEINSMIKAETFDEWVCFYIDTDKKLIVHVQPKCEEYNFETYTHRPIHHKTAKEIEDELTQMRDMQSEMLKSLADGLENLSADIEKTTTTTD